MGKIAAIFWIALAFSLMVYFTRNDPTFGKALVMPTVPAPDDIRPETKLHCPAGYTLGTDHGLKSSPGDEEVYRPWCFDDSGKTNGVAPK
jgi:hypothetical protein